ncbi:MAG: hypothetical protein Q9225_007112, partial [Loekoesia sp. 1 TL-2023]
EQDIADIVDARISDLHRFDAQHNRTFPAQEQPERENLIKRNTPNEKPSSPSSTPYKGTGRWGQLAWENKESERQVLL